MPKPKRLPQYARRRTHLVDAPPGHSPIVCVEGYERITSIPLPPGSKFQHGDRVIVEFLGMQVKHDPDCDRAYPRFRLIDPFTGNIELVG